MGVHAVDADEDQVHVDRPQRGDRERADERLRRRPHPAGQDDGLVRAADLVQDVRDADRVGDDGQSRDVRQPLRERVGRRARRTRRSPSPARRGRRPRRRSRPSRPAAARTSPRTPARTGRLPASVGRPAMDLLEEAALVEDLEVAPHGHVGDAELADEVRDADGAGPRGRARGSRSAAGAPASRRPPWTRPGPSDTLPTLAFLPFGYGNCDARADESQRNRTSSRPGCEDFTRV